MQRDRTIPSEEKAEGMIDRLRGWPLGERVSKEYQEGWDKINSLKWIPARVNSPT